MNYPTTEDIAAMERTGLSLDPEARVRDAGDVVFSGEWFEIIPFGGDEDDIRPARLT